MSIPKDVLYVAEDHCYVFECPHCDLSIQVPENQINCQIFVHGTMKRTGCQINPHASQEHCDRLVAKKLVYGCAKPFKLFRSPNGSIAYAQKYVYG